MKKLFALIILCAVALTFSSCGAKGRTAEELLSEFVSSYGAGGVIYSSEAGGEWEYADGEFFAALYGATADFESGFAVLLSSSLDCVYEAGVFVTHDTTSRLYAEELCRKRLDLLIKMGASDTPLLIKRKNVIFYGCLPDAERAERLWLDMRIT